MASKTEITCDACGADVQYTGNCVDYRLVLASQHKQPRSDVVTAMAIQPPIDRPHHFCGLPCLAHWLKDQSPALLEQYEKLITRRKRIEEQRRQPV